VLAVSTSMAGGGKKVGGGHCQQYFELAGRTNGHCLLASIEHDTGTEHGRNR
jgi:hypothetical protein